MGFCSDSVLRHSSSDFKKMGQRIFIFIIGGATRSEVALLYFCSCFGVFLLDNILINHFVSLYQLRVVHKLSSKLKREIILGSSSIDDPSQFITVSSVYPRTSIDWN